MSDLKINVTPTGNEVIIREGAARPIYEKPAIELTGTIRSVLAFDEKRSDTYEPTTVHVIMHYDNGTVQLVAKEQDKDGFTVTGKLIKHPFVESLMINKEKFWPISALASKLKVNRQYFGNREAYEGVIKALNTLEVNVTSNFKDQNDYAGNVVQQKIQNASHNIPKTFDLKVPVYQGFQAETINVTIEVVPDGQTIKVGLLSLDLVERETAIKEELFAEVKTKLGDRYAIIEQ